MQCRPQQTFDTRTERGWQSNTENGGRRFVLVNSTFMFVKDMFLIHEVILVDPSGEWV